MKKLLFVLLVAAIATGCKKETTTETPQTAGFYFDNKEIPIDKYYLSVNNGGYVFFFHFNGAMASNDGIWVSIPESELGKTIDVTKVSAWSLNYNLSGRYKEDITAGTINVKEIDKVGRKYQISFSFTFKDGKVLKGSYSGIFQNWEA